MTWRNNGAEESFCGEEHRPTPVLYAFRITSRSRPAITAGLPDRQSLRGFRTGPCPDELGFDSRVRVVQEGRAYVERAGGSSVARNDHAFEF